MKRELGRAQAVAQRPRLGCERVRVLARRRRDCLCLVQQDAARVGSGHGRAQDDDRGAGASLSRARLRVVSCRRLGRLRLGRQDGTGFGTVARTESHPCPRTLRCSRLASAVAHGFDVVPIVHASSMHQWASHLLRAPGACTRLLAKLTADGGGPKSTGRCVRTDKGMLRHDDFAMHIPSGLFTAAAALRSEFHLMEELGEAQ